MIWSFLLIYIMLLYVRKYAWYIFSKSENEFVSDSGSESLIKDMPFANCYCHDLLSWGHHFSVIISRYFYVNGGISIFSCENIPTIGCGWTSSTMLRSWNWSSPQSFIPFWSFVRRCAISAWSLMRTGNSLLNFSIETSDMWKWNSVTDGFLCIKIDDWCSHFLAFSGHRL